MYLIGFKYLIGIKLENKERYDRLMEEHSSTGMFGINFKESFDGYPQDYPCLLQFSQERPFGIFNMAQMEEIVDDGYLIQICIEES